MDSFSKCSICNSSYALDDKTPKILSCGDTFCSSCLISNNIIIQREDNDNNNMMMIMCVKCAKVTVLDNNKGVNGLITNNIVKELALRLVENEIDTLLGLSGSTYFAKSPNAGLQYDSNGGQKTQYACAFDVRSPTQQHAQSLEIESNSLDFLVNLDSCEFLDSPISSNPLNSLSLPIITSSPPISKSPQSGQSTNGFSSSIQEEEQTSGNTATTNRDAIKDHPLSLSSHSTINNEKLEITFHSHTLSKGVRSIIKLHSDALKGKEINIGNPNSLFSSSTQSSNMGQIVDNSSLPSSIFWKRDSKSSELFPLPFCCADCGLECIEFRCSSVKFSDHGKCQVPITLRCSPSHDKRPRATVLIMKIEITCNDIRLKGEITIPFKKHTKHTKSQISMLQSLLLEAEKNNPKKRKMLEEGEEETEQQQ